MTAHETAADIEQAAAGWLWRREAGDWGPEQARQLEAWLAVSTARQGAFLRAEAAWVSLDRMNWDAGASSPVRPQRSRRWLIGGAAMAVAASGAAALFWLPQGQSFVAPEREIRSMGLPDGSAVTLNAASALRADVTGAERRIRLKQGEAYFQVYHDPARPFVVAAGTLRVRAVGTAFSVVSEGAAGRVFVTEGVVEVWVEGQPEIRMKLTKGEGGSVDAQGHLVRTGAQVASERQLAWRYGRIDLDGETLAEAVTQFNRYNETRLIVADAALNDQRLYGVFDARDPLAFARAAGIALGAPVRQSDGRIQIGWTQTH